jgi:uncharacterized Rossmann fold enzyme
MLHICCIRAGDQFSPAYVSNLFDMVRRNLAEGFEGEFVCFTDQKDALDKGIKVRPLPADLPGWWSKLALFRRDLFPEGDRVIFFDLDTLITGRLDELASYDGPFAILRDFFRPNGMQSSVMAWRAGEQQEIWETYTEAGWPMHDPGGDQAWIERHACKGPVRFLQTLFPGMFVSYKQIKGPPEKASVVVFHGRPRPHEVVTGWVPEVWKVGGMSRAELDVVCNTARDRLTENVQSAIARDLQWFDTAPEHEGHVCIVGGGPSLVDCMDELAWRKSQGQKVVALNGAALYLQKKGLAPDAIVITDARPENAKFLKKLNYRRTAAFLASQCHPDVFEAASRFNTVLWHANTEGMAELLKDERARPVHLIGGGSTVGLNAMVLMFAHGFRKIHLYGFDSSYRDGDHHAYTQSLNDADRPLDALYGEHRFKTTPWMAQQVNDFVDLVPGLVADGCLITVAGDGLLPTVAIDLMNNLPPTPPEQRANAVLSRINGPAKGVEVGVFAGDMSRALLRMNPDLHLTMVDSWEGDGKAYTGDSGDFHAGLSDETQEEYLLKAIERTEFARGRRYIMRSRSVDAAMVVPGTFDFVFLDADHSYEGCKADIAAWLPKVKPGGWLGGHDYENPDFPKFGVTRAVDEFVAANGLELELAENLCWFVKIPATSQTGTVQ